MPELPEVETVKKYLEKEINGNLIINFELINKKSLRNENEKIFSKIINQKIIGFDRKAKHLILKLENSYLIMHLRMEGKFFIFENKKEMYEKTNRFYDVLILETNEKILLFQDKRRFATIDIFDNLISYNENPILNKIADEPFEININNLFNKLQKKKIKIKLALLDQSIISGLGNIYVDEVLYASKINPSRNSNKVTFDETKLIINNSIEILNKAIKYKGTTIKSYTSSLGVEGEYQKFLKVHKKENFNCERDNSKIIKIKIGGRGTYYCPTCQK